MKTKSIFLTFLLAAFAGTNLFAVTHGSIIKKNAPLTPEQLPRDAFWTTANVTVDFKAVTINNKVWATFTGKGTYNLANNPWSSQVQLWTGTAKTFEISINNAADYITVDRTNKTTTVTAYPLKGNEFNFNGFRAVQEDNNNFGWTEIMTYNQAAPNSGLTGDTEKPVLTSAVPGTQAGASLPITCEASDDSGDYFYLVTDASNNYAYASFSDAFTIGGLKAGTSYTLSVIAVDFSGNESDPLIIQIGEKQFESVLSGVAGDIEFELGSTATELQVRAKPVNEEATITTFKVQLGLENTTYTEDDPLPYEAVLNEWSGIPLVSYTIKNAAIFNTAPDKIIYLRFTYLLGPNTEPVSAEDWANVYSQTKIVSALSEGVRKGEKIAIKLGDGEVIPTALAKVDNRRIQLEQEGTSWYIRSLEPVRSVELYTVSGQKVYSGPSATVPVARLSKGVYVLKATDAKGYSETIKAIVK
jgi:hypothetical protein